MPLDHVLLENRSTADLGPLKLDGIGLSNVGVPEYGGVHLRLNDLLHHFTKGRLRYLPPSFGGHLSRALKPLDLRKLGFDLLVAFIVLRYRCLSIDEEGRHAVEVLSLRKDAGFVPYVVSL